MFVQELGNNFCSKCEGNTSVVLSPTHRVLWQNNNNTSISYTAIFKYSSIECQALLQGNDRFLLNLLHDTSSSIMSVWSRYRAKLQSLEMYSYNVQCAVMSAGRKLYAQTTVSSLLCLVLVWGQVKWCLQAESYIFSRISMHRQLSPVYCAMCCLSHRKASSPLQ